MCIGGEGDLFLFLFFAVMLTTLLAKVLYCRLRKLRCVIYECMDAPMLKN